MCVRQAVKISTSGLENISIPFFNSTGKISSFAADLKGLKPLIAYLSV
jgi:hypothetical protein